MIARSRVAPTARTGAPSEPASTRATGYVRVSTAGQVTDGDGLGVQRSKIEGWCAYQGIPLAAIEEDAGISGASTDNRPGLKRALRAVLEGGANSVLVVYKLDRLGRNAIDVQEALAVLLAGGVRVVSLADGVDSASGMGAALLRLLTGVLAQFAEIEKENITTRLQDGRRRADATDHVYTSEPGYGRRVVDATKDLAPDSGELLAVARIKALHGAGTSLRRICAVLEEEGIRPRRAATWSTSVVHRIATGHRAPKPKLGSKRLARARAEMLGADSAPEGGSNDR